MDSVLITRLDKYNYKVSVDGILDYLQVSEIVQNLSDYFRINLTKENRNSIQDYLVNIILKLSELEIDDHMIIHPMSTIEYIKSQNN